MATKTKKTATKKSTVKTKKPNDAANAKMRVAIAKDVLAQLKAKKIVPSYSTWIEDPKHGGIDTLIEDAARADAESIDVCEFVSKLNKCEVCALGSLFVSQVRLDDKTCEVFRKMNPSKTPTEAGYDVFEELNKSPLKMYFSKDQLTLIESTFEGGEGMHSPATEKDRALAYAYSQMYVKAADRLTAIMKNIISNNGTFIPKQEITTDALLKVVTSYM